MEEKNTIESFKDWLARFAKSEDAVQALTDGLHSVARRTAKNWVEQPTFQGCHLIEIQDFLVQQGFALSEMRDFSDLLRELHHLFAIKKIGFEDFAKLGISKDDTVRILRGVRNPSPEKVEKLKMLAATFKKTASPHQNVLGSLPSCPSVDQAMESVKGSMLVLAELLPIIEEKSTAEQRDYLRRSIGAEKIFKVNNAISRLCSETARRDIQRKP